MRWFGEAWPSEEEPAPICQGVEHMDTPVGEKCLDCTRPIAPGDQGVEIPYFGDEGDPDAIFYHLRCWIAQVIPRSMVDQILPE